MPSGRKAKCVAVFSAIASKSATWPILCAPLAPVFWQVMTLPRWSTAIASGLSMPHFWPRASISLLALDRGVEFVDAFAKTWFYGTVQNKVLHLIQFGVECLPEITATGVDRQISRRCGLHRLESKIPKFFRPTASCPFCRISGRPALPPPCRGAKHHSIMKLPPAPCKHWLAQSPDGALSQLRRCLPL